MRVKVHGESRRLVPTDEEQNDEPVRRLKLSKDGVNFSLGQHDRVVAVAFSANNAIDFTEISVQNVSEEEEGR